MRSATLEVFSTIAAWIIVLAAYLPLFYFAVTGAEAWAVSYGYSPVVGQMIGTFWVLAVLKLHAWGNRK